MHHDAAIWKAGLPALAWLQRTGQLKACMWQAGLEDLASVEVVASFPRITCAHTAVAGASAADTKDSVRPPGAFAVRLFCTCCSSGLAVRAHAAVLG